VLQRHAGTTQHNVKGKIFAKACSLPSAKRHKWHLVKDVCVGQEFPVLVEKAFRSKLLWVLPVCRVVMDLVLGRHYKRSCNISIDDVVIS